MYTMKTLTIFTITLFFAFCAVAQSGSKVAHTIKGKVVNTESNQPVSYTNIGLEGTFYGTASDEEGNFTLKVPEEMVGKNIYFSAVGFQNRQFPVKELFDREFNVVKLVAQSYDVGDVDVEAQNMVLIRILRMASENIRYNYGAGPFNLHCDYSKETVKSDSMKSATTAAVLIYDKTGYSKPGPLDAYKNRYYRVTKEGSTYSFSDNMLKIDELLSFDWVRSKAGVLNPALLGDYRLALKGQPTIDGEQFWVIAFKQVLPTLEGSGDYYASSFEGNITIRKDDYAVRTITAKAKAPKNNRQDRSLAVASGNKNYLENVSYEFTVEYRDLLIKQINLIKDFTYKGDRYEEGTLLKVTRAHANNLTVLSKRDYFPGE